MNKSELRRIYLEKRRSLPLLERSEKSRRAADRFFDLFDLTTLNTIHCFISIPRLREIDTSPIFERVWAEFPNVRTAAPRLNSATGEIESLRFTPETELVENNWGIREPAGNEIIDPTEIDSVIVPVLSYDRQGNRVGYGKGFYDRFLVKCRPECRKIGISFFAPEERIDEVGPHDVPLDYCLTPEASYTFTGKKPPMGRV